MASKQKLTPWFPANVKPARPGVYSASLYSEAGIFRYWDGCVWSIGQPSIELAQRHQDNKSTSMFSDRVCWRGLAEKPKDAA